ncbi:putative uncharacterized protein DDB_G0271606 isoform X2 [Venturia canescens]|uniref:putative uncharacterized protein DDB_G0271606 isoform X2 n=1 Tax=Venturia canescens TaxID=32260 RepID=UPI001C9D0F5D|nr:putative uncharacterized protein DDB_G0271606 isoform X2 [Venturia canescens]
MLACVYPSENFRGKAPLPVTKVRHGKSGVSRKKTKLLASKETRASETRSNNGSTTKTTNRKFGDTNTAPGSTVTTRVSSTPNNELPVGGGGAVLVLSELESMAARQQREIAQQRRLLEQREARLAVLRGAQEPAQQDRLARLRHRLDQQQSKLNRLRQLRSQTDQSRANNATLTSDLDCIRALFNEKEKELSLAVAKVEELTRQLEELRGRRNGANGSAGNGQMSTPASAELEKLRRELTYRNKINEQQNQVVSQQRLALAQRQAEMASIDARIAQLQGRLQRKRALNQRLSQQLGTANRPVTTQPGFQDVKHDFNNSVKQRPAGNVAAIEPYSHIPNDNDFNLNKNDPKYQTLPYNTKFTVNFKPTEDDVNKNKIQHSASASQIGQRSTFQQFGHQIAHSQSQSHIQGQSQLLGQQSSQQHQTNPQGYAPQSSNLPSSQSSNNNNNNNNNINANNQQTSGNNQGTSQNVFVQEAPSQVQSSRLHTHQQQQQQQQQQHQPQQLQHTSIAPKQQQSSTNSSNSSLASGQSITQSYNHRNLQTHQKPVSSVAPSFPVKSPIYQTSSTKIHPVMPQTLSLIGRSHTTNIERNYPNHSIGPPSSQSPQGQQLTQTIGGHQESNFPLRQNYQHASQTPGQYSSYRTQNSPNLPSNVAPPTHVQQANSNYSAYPSQSYNQTSQSGDPSQQPNERSKFEGLKSGALVNQEKYELPLKHEPHVRYEQQGLPKHDNQKYEHTSQTTKSYEQMPPKSDQNNAGQQQHQNVNKYESTTKHDQNKFEAPQTRHEQQHHTGKFEQSQLLPGVHQVKHELHEARGSNAYELNSQFKHEQLMKHESTSNFSQFKPLQDNSKFEISRDNKIDHASQSTNQMGKHDHTAKFEPPNKIAEKPYEFDRIKSDNDRKLINFSEPKNEDKQKPALPPKPSKPNPPPRLTHHEKNEVTESIVEAKTPAAPITLNLRSEKEEDIPPIPTSELPESPIETPITNHQIIKARPLALKKAPLSEQPRLRYAKSNVHVSINRRIEMPPAFLFPETEIPADLMQSEQQTQQTTTQQQQQQQQQSQNLPDVTDNCKKSLNVGICEEISSNDKLEDADIVDALNIINIEDKVKNNKAETDKRLESEIDCKNNTDVVRRKKGNLKSTTGKANLSRRVSFDPLALLLDASLEGELELVKKTAKEVANPSSANDEGITALHNAICAGHLEIVKFLVEFGCDVNAQDSDGWTPLHCAASCNNLAMVRFLVEHGACIFATTLSDHETAAEKCEEDEEGFDGCSEYLYSVQEKLGIMNNGQVYAVFDYEAQHSDELTLKNGDSLVILRKGDDNEREWWWSKLGNREGYVPRNLLGLYPRVQPAKAD